MSSASAITLRYRSSGHVRYQVSASLCSPTARERIAAELREIEGVYRVDYYPRQRKIAIRFIESVCSPDHLDASLRRLAAAAPAASCCAAENRAVSTTEQAPAGFAPTRWLRDKLGRVGAPATTANLPARRSAGLPWLKESTVIEFLNDALVLFLIKLHWHMITQHWLRQPWRYRYEWLAALYLIYLLVRSRRPKKS